MKTMTPLDARDFLTEIYLNELDNKEELAPVREAFNLAIKSLEVTNKELRYEETVQHKRCTHVSALATVQKPIEKPQTKLERVLEYLIKSGAKFIGKNSFLMISDTYCIRNNNVHYFVGYGRREDTEKTDFTVKDILEGWFQIKFKDKWLKVKPIKEVIAEPEYVKNDRKRIAGFKKEQKSPENKTLEQFKKVRSLQNDWIQDNNIEESTKKKENLKCKCGNTAVRAYCNNTINCNGLCNQHPECNLYIDLFCAECYEPKAFSVMMNREEQGKGAFYLMKLNDEKPSLKHDWIQGKLMEKAVKRMSIESRTKFTSWNDSCKRPLIDNKEKNI